MRYFRDAGIKGFCGALISVALVPEDVNLAPFYEGIDCADPTDWVRESVLPVLQAERRRAIESRIFSPIICSTIPIRYW
jgi:hypothetical protein